jgi:hypothetical protein
MVKKDYIIIASITVNIILGSWIFYLTKDDQAPSQELFKSQGRVEVLEKTLLEKDAEINILNTKIDSVNVLLAKKPKERIVIKEKYYEKISDVINVPLDSGISILAGRLSEVNIDR